ncbi:MAG: threonine-phosphate decarboxylase CobD [Proteobacteria bacterium]|nr:threonine-phosphate decarboxylase CobD [Pseudomonadota bacterium]
MALEHGGRVRAAAQRYGIAEDCWLDLSTGINPDGWPVPAIPGEIWQQLPQDDDGLADAARNYYGTARLLPVAGSQAAIQALPRLRTPCRVALLATSYAEHAHAWQQHGHQVRCVAETEILQADAQVVVIVNPNNPTGKRYSVAELLELHERLAARGGWLVVDEAFMDATPEHSLAPFCPRAGLIVLRSLGKFFGLAGARVGFVLTQDSVLQSLAEMLGPWTIAAPARYVATLALRDTDWQQASRSTLQVAGLRLYELLMRYGLQPTGGSSLFQWVCCDDAASIHEQLVRQGILTRLFDAPASLRFGLPCGEGERSEGAWARLDAALGKIKQ